MITENLMCGVSTYLRTVWGLVSVPLNSKVKLKSTWNAYCSCRGTIYIYIYREREREPRTKSKGADID